MKFKGEPNLYIKIQKRHKLRIKGIKFSADGEFETDDEQLIKLLSLHFDRIADLKHCKKCDFTCENQGELMRHYKENHPKEG